MVNLTTNTIMNAKDFWNNIFSQGTANPYSRVEMPNLNDPVLNTALSHFGNVSGKTLIDLGCGRGASSLFFAYHGATVISIDLSEVAIKNLSMYCLNNQINNIKAINIPAQQISSLEPVDCIFGSMILHHIEPFHEFAGTLANSLASGGKAFFYENNAMSNLLIWFRENLVGKFWIPKYGDPEEFPLTSREIDELRKYLSVRVEYPELLFFRLISTYLLRGKLSKPFEFIDNYFYQFSNFRKYSYRQYLFIEKCN